MALSVEGRNRSEERESGTFYNKVDGGQDLRVDDGVVCKRKEGIDQKREKENTFFNKEDGDKI